VVGLPEMSLLRLDYLTINPMGKQAATKIITNSQIKIERDRISLSIQNRKGQIEILDERIVGLKGAINKIKSSILKEDKKLDSIKESFGNKSDAFKKLSVLVSKKNKDRKAITEDINLLKKNKNFLIEEAKISIEAEELKTRKIIKLLSKEEKVLRGELKDSSVKVSVLISKEEETTRTLAKKKRLVETLDKTIAGRNKEISKTDSLSVKVKTLKEEANRLEGLRIEKAKVLKDSKAEVQDIQKEIKLLNKERKDKMSDIEKRERAIERETEKLDNREDYLGESAKFLGKKAKTLQRHYDKLGMKVDVINLIP